jgi:hypothetical protein
LRSTGWSERPSPRPGAVLFTGPQADDGEAIVQLVPVSDGGRDYPLRIEDLLRSLSQLEDRPAADILWDIITADCDRVVFQFDQDGPAGTVPLDQGLQLLRQARELILQAAAVGVSTEHWRLRIRPTGPFTFAIELPLTDPSGNGAAVAPERGLTCSLAEQLAALEQPPDNGEGPVRSSTPVAEVLGQLLEAAKDGIGLTIRIVYGRSGSQAGPPAQQFRFSHAARAGLPRLPAAS